jgi:signal transduction histidine kinase/glycine cleavage system H lipoate-binding protein
LRIGRYEFPEDRFYDHLHNWVQMEDRMVVQGMTAYALQMAGAILYIELPRIGRQVEQGEQITALETEAGIVRLRAAVSGEIAATNPQLRENARLIHRDTYGEGWIVKIFPFRPEELQQLQKPDDPAFQRWFEEHLAGETVPASPDREVLALRKDLERAYTRMETLYEIARAATSSLDLQEVLQTVVQRTAQAFDAKGASIRLLDDSGQFLKIATAWGLSADYLQKGPVEVQQSGIDREALQGRPVIVLDAPRDPRTQYPEEVEREGICTILCCPLTVRDKAIGVLRVYSAVCERYGDREADFLLAIASEAAVAIANAMAYQELEQIDQAKSQFVLTVTHELRSPVATVQSLLRVISGGYAGEVSEKQKELIARAERRIVSLQRLVDDLLDLAAGKTEHLAEAPRPVTVNVLVQKVVNQLRPVSEEKQQELEVVVAKAPLRVIATEEGIERILVNLVGNAIKYTPPGGRVGVLLERLDQEVRLVVRDTGIGIPEEAQGHLFEEFFRAENAKAIEREGTGLGLSIVKNLVDRYGGRIGVESVVNEGTTLTVLLPLQV